MPLPAQPVEVELGKERLHIQKDVRCDGSLASNTPDLVVFNPDLDSGQINYSLRIKAGQSLHLNRDQPYQEHLFHKPRKAFRRNFHLDHAGEKLIFRDSNAEHKTFVTVLEQTLEQSPIVTQRRNAIDEIIALFGGPLEAMPPDQALATIQQVNALLQKDAFRTEDASGTAGGLVELPAHITPVVIG
ncbi:unnamed protein product, partial [marine sediment metagenome]